MYNIPSSRRRKKKKQALNLTPILDVVFILIFFLLTSVQIIKIYEIGSDLPIYRFSDDLRNEEKKKLELHLIVDLDEFKLLNRVSGKLIRKIDAKEPNSFESLQKLLRKVKERFPNENRIIISSVDNFPYQNLVNLMDKIREFYDDSGHPVKLFNQIMFEN